MYTSTVLENICSSKSHQTSSYIFSLFRIFHLFLIKYISSLNSKLDNHIWAPFFKTFSSSGIISNQFIFILELLIPLFLLRIAFILAINSVISKGFVIKSSAPSSSHSTLSSIVFLLVRIKTGTLLPFSLISFKNSNQFFPGKLISNITNSGLLFFKKMSASSELSTISHLKSFISRIVFMFFDNSLLSSIINIIFLFNFE
jgi:hypothetical protein